MRKGGVGPKKVEKHCYTGSQSQEISNLLYVDAVVERYCHILCLNESQKATFII